MPDAGLSEITFSIHGHNAKVHDALVGVQGAFEEEVRGLQLALADGRPIVNIDVCLNRGNIKGIPKLLDRFIEMGVREYDLLHIIPFGRAFDEIEERRRLFYNIDEAMPALQYALKLSERPDMHIWFNRFPPPYLEGYEYLIQDPYKLKDEVRGRFAEYERLLDTGVALSCREPARCERCYLEELCDTLDEVLEHRAEDSFEIFRLELDADGQAPLPPLPGTYSTSWIKGPQVHHADAQATKLPGEKLILSSIAMRASTHLLSMACSAEKSLRSAMPTTLRTSRHCWVLRQISKSSRILPQASRSNSCPGWQKIPRQGWSWRIAITSA